MKKLVWVAGVILLLSFVFPNGVTLPKPITPVPVDPQPVTPAADKDPKIVEILAVATPADKARIYGVYTAMATVTRRDAGRRLNTTEKWAEYQANTLQLAIDTPGKYPGLDLAIEDVFARKLGTDDVLALTPEVVARIASAADIIAASAQ
jgi:hypothetical protein